MTLAPRLSVADAVAIARDVGDALDYAQRGLVALASVRRTRECRAAEAVV
ncbi:MAG: hypothetical protein ACM357_04805 [Gemmatimonadota bacterium]